MTLNKQKATLWNICLQVTDGKHGDCVNQENSGYYFLSAKDIKNDHIEYSQAREITHSDFIETDRRTRFEMGDILITNSGTIGRMAMPRQPTITRRTTFQKSVAILKPNAKLVSNMYLFYYLKSKLIHLIELSGGTAQKNLLLKDLRTFIVELPERKLQEKIALMISNYDDLIDNNSCRIQLLESMAKLIYDEWFVKFKFPGYEKVKMVDSELGKIPEGWDVKKIEDVCFKINSGGTPSRNNESFWKNGTVNWFKTKELQDNFLFDSEEKISIEGLKLSSAKEFPHGAVIMAIYAAPTVGRLGILTKNSTFNQAAVGIIPNKDIFEEEFMFFKLIEMRKYFNSLAQGAAQQNISVEKVKNSKIVVPRKDVTHQFAQIVRPMMKHIKYLTEKNINLKSTRDLLLPKLISGEIDVSELDIKVPEVRS